MPKLEQLPCVLNLHGAKRFVLHGSLDPRLRVGFTAKMALRVKLDEAVNYPLNRVARLSHASEINSSRRRVRYSSYHHPIFGAGRRSRSGKKPIIGVAQPVSEAGGEFWTLKPIE